jgi:hypothetical protein
MPILSNYSTNFDSTIIIITIFSHLPVLIFLLQSIICTLFSGKISMTAAVEAREFVDKFNADYETRHRAFEEQFWGTKMALNGARYSAEELTRTKTEMEALLQDKAVLEKAQELRSQLTDDDLLIKTLDIIIRTCQCYQMNDEAAAIRRETSQIESSLEMARNTMKLGYLLDDGTFAEASSYWPKATTQVNPVLDVQPVTESSGFILPSKTEQKDITS